MRSRRTGLSAGVVIALAVGSAAATELGIAATCLHDNMKVVVARYEDGEPIYNTRFLAFATHYGFRPVACRRRRPQTKAKWSGRSTSPKRAC